MEKSVFHASKILVHNVKDLIDYIKQVNYHRNKLFGKIMFIFSEKKFIIRLSTFNIRESKLF